VRVVGDIGDLEPVAQRGADPDRVRSGPELDAAVHLVVRLLEQNLERFAAEQAP
jgi:hypothetical protein